MCVHGGGLRVWCAVLRTADRTCLPVEVGLHKSIVLGVDDGCNGGDELWLSVSSPSSQNKMLVKLIFTVVTSPCGLVNGIVVTWRDPYCSFHSRNNYITHNTMSLRSEQTQAMTCTSLF